MRNNVRYAHACQFAAGGMMPGELDDRTILVTGASKGIGAAIARACGAAGARVIAHYGRDRAGAEAATAEIAPERRLLLEADLGDLRAVQAMWNEAAAWQGRVDVLVNNAAVMLWDGGFDESEPQWDAVWEETLAVNVLAPARLMRGAVNHFLEMGGGAIVTISSWAAQRGVTNPATIAYGASKAAVRSATQSVARGYARQNIQAYIVAPGVVRTRLSEQFAATQPGGEAAVAAGLASGEWVEPDELARLVVFLASGVAPQLSGATLDVNGASYIR
ncbi:SDR family oxidoreductase [Sphingomonas baiyangensis]|uniref:SDR family oxidoreductase n=2 Tax=Sphingomonas baiyangensis TaxID=2572576 RepID=A0A4U1L010_9SPHN|nr:SDR family oxidoreductase [Sphingomonas baiyangensis]